MFSFYFSGRNNNTAHSAHTRTQCWWKFRNIAGGKVFTVYDLTFHRMENWMGRATPCPCLSRSNLFFVTAKKKNTFSPIFHCIRWLQLMHIRHSTGRWRWRREREMDGIFHMNTQYILMCAHPTRNTLRAKEKKKTKQMKAGKCDVK